jgi:predicted RNase H-like HicB family nuclease
MENKYNFSVIWSGEDNEFVGLCSEFPGLSWLDSDPKRAMNGIKRLVAEVIEDIKDEQGTLEKVKGDELICRGEDDG